VKNKFHESICAEGMSKIMPNVRLNKIVIEVVENQLRANDPPATKATYERLQGLGYTKQQAKEKIAAVVLEEIFDVMKNTEQFNEARFTKCLNALK